jgi:hypothetical protein
MRERATLLILLNRGPPPHEPGRRPRPCGTADPQASGTWIADAAGLARQVPVYRSEVTS